MNEVAKLKSTVLRASVLCLAVAAGASAARAQRYQDFTTLTPLKEGDTLILGFMGGRESWDNNRRGVRKLALRLRARKLPGVHIETVENKKRRVAVELIRSAFDRDRDGRLDGRERSSARVIVYGQSFGGAAVVKLARQLDRMGVPVLLTVQVDSVGRGDKVIRLCCRNCIEVRGGSVESIFKRPHRRGSRRTSPAPPRLFSLTF